MVMKRIIAACLGVTMMGMVVWAQERSKVSNEEGRILALETAWNHAEENKDSTALDQLLASTLVYVDYDGSVLTKGEFLAQIKAVDLHPSQVINDEMTALVYGDAAVVTGTYREKGTNKGKAYVRRGRFTDTWVRVNGTWQCVASQSTLIAH
jgi:ketosteroid isomerase-like protein